jgi:hypothetical protein
MGDVGNVYAGAYANLSEAFLDVILLDADGDSVVREHAYCERNSPVGRQLEELLRDGRWHGARIRLGFVGPDKKPGNELRILDLIDN